MLNLQESPGSKKEDEEQHPSEKYTSMVILRAPPGSTIQNMEKPNASYVQKGFDNILCKPADENRQQLQLLIDSRQSYQFKNQ